MKTITIPLLCLLNIVVTGCIAQNKLLQFNNLQSHWSALENKAISNDAKWLAYTLNYPEVETDTLYIVSTSSDKRFKIPQSKMGMFSDDSHWFIGRGFPHNYHFINLLSNRQFFRDVVTEVFFLPNKGSMLLYHPEQNRLHIAGNLHDEDIHLENVTDFAFHSVSGSFALVEQQANGNHKLMLGNSGLKDFRKLKSSPVPITDLIWDNTGEQIAFYQIDTTKGEAILHQIKLNGMKTTALKMPLAKLPAQQKRNLQWSIDGDMLFYSIACPNSTYTLSSDKSKVEIWQSHSKWLPPHSAITKEPYKHYVNAWFADTGQVNAITSDSVSFMLPGNHDKFAVVYKHSNNSPYFTLQPDVDIYVKNIRTNTSHLLLKEYKGDLNTIKITPSGNLVTYFEKGEWWGYHTGNRKRYRLSENINEEVADSTYDLPGEVKPFGLAGYVKGSEDLLFYGENDLWSVSPDGKRAQRLTSSAKTKLRYRLLSIKPYGIILQSQNSINLKPIDLNKGVLLSVTADDYSTGVQKLSHKGIEPMIMESAYIDEVVCSQDLNACSYISQTYHKPPSLWHIANNDGPEKIIQSNPHFVSKSNKKPELLHYTGIDGKPLKAALFYPDNYLKGKVYPMIISIYERRSKLLHHFFLPIENQHDGFSPSRYTADGYLVLMPDISYKIGEPGNSALYAVNAAIDEAITKGVVDEQNIGIIGHSFGGYQTAYILARSQRFKTGVLGAAVTDPVGFYHSMLAFGKDNMWRYENYQMRMGIPFYENPKDYLENSPLFLSGHIQTPVMLWSGANDTTVDPKNSIALFLALRRREQNAILYLYPDEPHVLYKKENQIDLSRRIKSWFDLHLK